MPYPFKQNRIPQVIYTFLIFLGPRYDVVDLKADELFNAQLLEVNLAADAASDEAS
jgi:hypothetical protein